MRIFWSIIAILVIATAGLLISRRLDTGQSPATPTPAAPTQLAQARPPTPRPVAPPIQPRQPDPAATPTPVPQPTPTPAQPQVPETTPTPAPAPSPTVEPTPDTPTPTDPPAPTPAETPVESPAETPVESPVAKPAEPPASDTTPPALADAPASTPPASTPPATITPPGGRARPTATPEDIAAAESTRAEPTLARQSDGTTLVAERFIIKGDGSKDNPYEVTWEHLMSAQETYKPRLGLKIIPGWLNLIHDKWVKVSGYVAFPVMAQGPDEMLMMLNQWDGCCIGVPPTPYDAIEVKLAKPAEGETRLLIMGTVTGKLKVDPYLVKDWLVSLYIMDEAVVSKQAGAPLRESEVVQEHLAP